MDKKPVVDQEARRKRALIVFQFVSLQHSSHPVLAPNVHVLDERLVNTMQLTSAAPVLSLTSYDESTTRRAAKRRASADQWD